MTPGGELIEDPGPWPVARLHPISRLRALAAGLAGVAIEERQLDASFESVWGFIADLERSIPTFDRSVASIRILDSNGSRLRIRAVSSWRVGFVPVHFDVQLEPGWCWMVSRPRLYVIGMAAVPDGDGTRYAHMEGFSIPGRPFRPLLRFLASRYARHIRADLDGIERSVE